MDCGRPFSEQLREHSPHFRSSVKGLNTCDARLGHLKQRTKLQSTTHPSDDMHVSRNIIELARCSNDDRRVIPPFELTRHSTCCFLSSPGRSRYSPDISTLLSVLQSSAQALSIIYILGKLEASRLVICAADVAKDTNFPIGCATKSDTGQSQSTGWAS